MPTERHYMIKVRTKLCFKTSPASWPFTFPGRSLLYQLFFLTLLLSASWSQLDLLITLTPAQPVQFTDSAKKPSLSPLSSSSCYFLSSPSHLNVPNTALTVFILVISTYFLTDSKLNSAQITKQFSFQFLSDLHIVERAELARSCEGERPLAWDSWRKTISRDSLHETPLCDR